MKHISEIIRKDLGLNRENSSLLDEKTKIYKHLVDKLKDKPYIIENAYLKENNSSSSVIVQKIQKP